MRGSRWFIFFVLAFLLLMFAIEYHLPKKFVWVPTFSHYDEQPFGCAVFDSLLTVSLPSGYTLSRKTFYQMEQEDTVHNKGILLIATNLPFGRVDIEALLKMADRGNKIMLVSSSFTKILEDTLKFDCTYSYFRSVDLKKYAASLLKRDSIYWIGDPEVYSRQVFRFYPQFCKSYFRRYDSLPVRKLAEINLASDMGTHWMNWILRPFPAIIIRWWLWCVRGERVKSFWFLLLCFLPIMECWMRKMRLTYSASCRRWESCLLSAPKDI